MSAAYSVLRTQNDEEKQAATVDCSQRPHRCCRLTTKVENVDRELSLRTIGADLHRTTVATAPGEKLITGRRPVRNWTRRTISSLFLCRKLHLLLGKSTKTAANGPAVFWLQYASNRLSAVALPHTPCTMGSLHPSARSPSCI